MIDISIKNINQNRQSYIGSGRKKMVHKYPNTLKKLKQERVRPLPKSEEKIFEVLDVLDNEWYVWHSVNWYNDTEPKSGEGDFLFFHEKYGFVILEVKGGHITVENKKFYSTDSSGTKHLIKDPFAQAENTVFEILHFYTKRAHEEPNTDELLKDEEFFPLNFHHAVAFPDCPFKDTSETIQFRYRMIFDETDYVNLLDWINEGMKGKNPLESFILTLLNNYKKLREIKPKVGDFFRELMGANISQYLTIRKYIQMREEELKRIDLLQDFLLKSLSKKRQCFFQGSAGSGKTYIAMKKALMNHENGLHTLFLCFNVGLRDFVKSYFEDILELPYKKVRKTIQVYSVKQLLYHLVMAESTPDEELLQDALKNFEYEPLAEFLTSIKDEIPQSLQFDAIIIDEAQDIEQCLWPTFQYFLKNQEESMFYVFFDQAQSIFTEDLSSDEFGMEPESDLIVLTRNLRNTIEIVEFLEENTNLGEYDEYSGINGLEVSQKVYSSAKEAVLATMTHLRNNMYKRGINPSQISVLSTKKLKNLITKCKSKSFGDFVSFKDRETKNRLCLVEPECILELPDIKKKLRSEWITLFKTIRGFKGLESDIIYIIVPKMGEYESNYPSLYDEFRKEIYVGVSRAKFILHFYEYHLPDS